MSILDWFRRPTAPAPAGPPRDPRALLAPHRRRAWLPVVAEGDAERDGSKLGGTPWLAAGEAWPACGNCGRPMQLFVQLNPRDLPGSEGARLHGALLQLFYCTSQEPFCEVDCEAFHPGARSTLLRLVRAEGRPAEPSARPPGEFPPRRIEGWREVEDFPNQEELGVELSDAESAAMFDLRFPQRGDKWGGWPDWIQNVEYPECPECGRSMELLFQLASEDNLPFMFGDMGTGHVTQCPAYPERLAFGWACS